MPLEADDRKGRFIKKDDKILRTLKVNDFSFEEIAPTEIIYHDNLTKSVFLSRMHSKEHMKKSVKEPEKFLDPLTDEPFNRILKPIDFTADWMREKSRESKKGSRLYDDEDDLDFDFEAALRGDQSVLGSENETEVDEDEEGKEFEKRFKQSTKKPKVIEPDTSRKSRAPDDQNIPSNFEASQQVMLSDSVIVRKQREVIAELKQVRSENVDEQLKSAENIAPMQPTVEATANLDKKIKELTEKPSQPESSSKETELRAWEERLQQQQKDLEEQSKKLSQGYQENLDQGLKEAKDKAMEQQKLIFSRVQKLLQELSQLKKDILSNVQDNFGDISTSIAESLLKKHFRVDPAALAYVIESVITEQLADDEITIKISPSALESLSEVVPEQIKAKLIADDGIEEGDFKVESKLSSVDGNLQNHIKRLLEKADIKLFEENEYQDQDSDDKAS